MITACYDRILARLSRLSACDSRLRWDWAGNVFYDRWQRRLYERALRDRASWTPTTPEG